MTDEERDAFIRDVVYRTSTTLAFAHLGLDDYSAGGPRRLYGLFNVAVWGRAVTNVAHHLRTVARAEYDLWYAPRRFAMEADPLMKYFYDLRTSMLKDGTGGPTSHGTVIVNVTSGHVIQSPTTSIYPDAPTMHRGRPLAPRLPVADLCALYLAWLDEFVVAHAEFAETLKAS